MNGIEYPMQLSGATFVRNAVKYDYPITAVVKTLLNLCTEVVIGLGQSDDGTDKLIYSLTNPKLKIIPTVWDDKVRDKGLVLSQQTNLVLAQCTGDWILYLQADEVIHENDYDRIYATLNKSNVNNSIAGLLFHYYHFYGSYYTYQTGRDAYRREVRIIRNHQRIQSYGDAQGFRIGTRKLNVADSKAHIYHYGWVRPPELMQKKIVAFDRFYHPDNWINRKHTKKNPDDYFTDWDNLSIYPGTHPQVMYDRINLNHLIPTLQKWETFRRSRSWWHRMRAWSKKVSIGEHRNFYLRKS